MKKLFFSAVALVAFSSVSMANTIAVEEVKDKLVEKIETINVLSVQDKVVANNYGCFSYAIRQMDMVEAHYGEISDIIDYNNLYQKYVAICQAVGPVFGGGY